jgi:hypothetical protein
MPLAMAPVAYLLDGRILRHNPRDLVAERSSS